MADVQQQAGGAVVAALSKGASAAQGGGMIGAIAAGFSGSSAGVLMAGAVGVLGILVKACIDVFFRWQDLKLKRRMAAKNVAPFAED